MKTESEIKDLVYRLRGIYRIPITDGLGPAGGEEPDNPDYFVRTFESTAINKEAADVIEQLLNLNSAQKSEITEKELHKIFESFHMKGEWFRYSGHLKACIMSIKDAGRKHKEVKTVRQFIENGYHLQVRQKENRNTQFKNELKKYKE